MHYRKTLGSLLSIQWKGFKIFALVLTGINFSGVNFLSSFHCTISNWTFLKELGLSCSVTSDSFHINCKSNNKCYKKMKFIGFKKPGQNLNKRGIHLGFPRITSALWDWFPHHLSKTGAHCCSSRLHVFRPPKNLSVEVKEPPSQTIMQASNWYFAF